MNFQRVSTPIQLTKVLTIFTAYECKLNERKCLKAIHIIIFKLLLCVMLYIKMKIIKRLKEETKEGRGFIPQ